MSLDFMKPEIWDGLVIGVTLIGVALAILRLIDDRAAYQRKQQAQTRHKQHDID